MARVLVEVDLHAGLLETLDIEWRDQLYVQRLDYLGISFCCSLCRRTGHLRKDCSQPFGVTEKEDTPEPNLGDCYSPLDDTSLGGPTRVTLQPTVLIRWIPLS
jgi:hypothetical protein